MVNAGHDLNLRNIPPLMQAVPFLAEASIGHELTADALENGFRGDCCGLHAGAWEELDRFRQLSRSAVALFVLLPPWRRAPDDSRCCPPKRRR